MGTYNLSKKYLVKMIERELTMRLAPVLLAFVLSGCSARQQPTPIAPDPPPAAQPIEQGVCWETEIRGDVAIRKAIPCPDNPKATATKPAKEKTRP